MVLFAAVRSDAVLKARDRRTECDGCQKGAGKKGKHGA